MRYSLFSIFRIFFCFVNFCQKIVEPPKFFGGVIFRLLVLFWQEYLLITRSIPKLSCQVRTPHVMWIFIVFKITLVDLSPQLFFLQGKFRFSPANLIDKRTAFTAKYWKRSGKCRLLKMIASWEALSGNPIYLGNRFFRVWLVNYSVFLAWSAVQSLNLETQSNGEFIVWNFCDFSHLFPLLLS